jgi:DNA mismatch repair protein MutH
MAGQTLGQLALRLGITTPRTLQRAKGWTGELIERQLGAYAGSTPQPDFPDLKIELKTLPIGINSVPTESTFVSVVPLADNIGITWQTSAVRAKLARVLWIPVQADRQLAVADRIIGTPLLWSPSAREDAVFETDFNELMEMVAFGRMQDLSAHYGTWLQVRPKAANAKALTPGFDANGQRVMTLPLGFYLRRAFTRQLLERHYA